MFDTVAISRTFARSPDIALPIRNAVVIETSNFEQKKSRNDSAYQNSKLFSYLTSYQTFYS